MFNYVSDLINCNHKILLLVKISKYLNYIILLYATMDRKIIFLLTKITHHNKN